MKWLTNPFVLDLRSLSALRIGLGLVLLVDLYIRWGDLGAHYSEEGVLPLHVLFQYHWLPNFFSVYLIGNSPFWAHLLMACNTLCLVAMALGYRTRLFTVLSWVFLVSIQNRNGLVEQGGDDLLRLLVFWGMFLPWGAYFSYDTMYIPRAAPKYVSVAGIGYILLLFSLYFFSALLKNGAEWNKEYTALYYALSLDMIVLPGGKMLYAYPNLMRVLTAFIYYLELFGPFLLFIPLRNELCRLLFVLLFLLMHLGIACTLYVGLFPFISIVALVGLLPTSVWEFWTGMFKVKSQNTLMPLEEPAWKSSACTFLAVYCLYLNAVTVWPYELLLDQYVRPMAYLLRIDQKWGMFAPTVFRDDGWFIMEANTPKGKIDIYDGGQSVCYQKPGSVVSKVKNDRWRKYQENILFVDKAYLRPYYCQWLGREWNKKATLPFQVSSLEIVYMKEVTLPDFERPLVSREVLCSCILAPDTKQASLASH